MDFKSSPLYLEVQKITRSQTANVLYNYKVEIQTENKLVQSYFVKTIDTEHDYEFSYSEVVIISFLMGLGDYHYDIYRNRRNLELTLIRTERENIVSSSKTAVTKKRFKAVLIETGGDRVIQSQSNNGVDRHVLNRQGMQEVQLQLIDPAFYELRMRLIGSSFRQMTNETLVKSLLASESAKVSTPGDESIIGVSMMAVNNTKEMSAIVIPHATRLVDLVDYLQNKGSGLYSTGAGLFYLDRMWYVYSLYDTTRFNKEKEVISIVVVPPTVMPGVERSFTYLGSVLKLIASGEIKIEDDSEQKDLNEGNGSRITDANSFISGFSTTEENKTRVLRPENNSEFILGSRLDGKNYAPVSENQITANPFKQYSDLARRACAFLTLVWYNGRMDYVRPGMPVKIQYLSNSDVKELTGVLVRVHSHVAAHDMNYQETNYVNTIALGIAVDRSPILNNPE